jgi:hypothetical protein
MKATQIALWFFGTLITLAIGFIATCAKAVHVQNEKLPVGQKTTLKIVMRQMLSNSKSRAANAVARAGNKMAAFAEKTEVIDTPNAFSGIVDTDGDKTTIATKPKHTSKANKAAVPAS